MRATLEAVFARVAVAAAVGLLAALTPAAAARPQDPAAAPDPQATGPLFGPGGLYRPGEYLGPRTCATSNCHGKTEPGTEYDVFQDEYTVWFGSDPHRRAADVLANEESALIARNLGLAEPAPRAPQCVACHGLRVPKNLQARPLEAADGVSCEGCHGPAGGWIEDHTKETWSHQQSVAAGMVDLRDVARRTRVCAGCHLGDDGREVAHDLIAAGHPELTFELDNGEVRMQFHWIPYEDLLDKRGRRQTHFERAWAVGQIEVLRQRLSQLARRAASERWPEFAEMSCDACHHPLAGGEERQRRGYRDRPGLPRWSPASWIVARHLVRAYAAEEYEALAADVASIALHVGRMRATTEELRATAARAVSTLDRVLPRVDRGDLSAPRLRELLRTIVGDREELAFADRQSAEQIYLSIQSLLYALKADPAGGAYKAAGELCAAAAMKGCPEGAAGDPYRYDPKAFAAALAKLEGQLPK